MRNKINTNYNDHNDDKDLLKRIIFTYCCKCDCCVFLTTVFGMFVALKDQNSYYILNNSKN